MQHDPTQHNAMPRATAQGDATRRRATQPNPTCNTPNQRLPLQISPKAPQIFPKPLFPKLLTPLPHPHTTPRGTGSPVAPRLGRGLMVRCADGLTGPPQTSTRCGCSCWCAGWVGGVWEGALPEAETRLGLCRQDPALSPEGAGRGDSHGLELPLSSWHQGQSQCHQWGDAGSDDGKTPPFLAPPQPPLNHLLCLFQELPDSPGHPPPPPHGRHGSSMNRGVPKPAPHLP